MISVYQGLSSSIIFHGIRQVSSLANPYYIFDILNKNSKLHTIMTAQDISLAPGLYQEFEWKEGINGLTQGQFIADVGEYKVTVYDTLYNDLNIASASSILTVDELRVYGDTGPAITSITSGVTFVYIK